MKTDYTVADAEFLAYELAKHTAWLHNMIYRYTGTSNSLEETGLPAAAFVFPKIGN